MTIAEAGLLFGTMLLLALVPSTSVALVVARSASLGLADGLAVALGIVLADLCFVALAIFGLSAVADTMGGLFVMVKLLGGIYLVWFGFSLIAQKRHTDMSARAAPSKKSLLAGFASGLLLTFGDIKAIFFYGSLLPVFVDLTSIQPSEIFTILWITFISVGGAKILYAVLAKKVAAYFAEYQKTGSYAKKALGGLLIGAGGYLIVKI